MVYKSIFYYFILLRIVLLFLNFYYEIAENHTNKMINNYLIMVNHYVESTLLIYLAIDD